MADISIVIVTWNSEDEILSCLQSVLANIKLVINLKTELIIIDNNSSDETINIVKNLNYNNIHIYKNSTNLGFTKAANQGIKYAQGKYIFLLNPDTFLSDDCLLILYNFLEMHDDYAASCPRLMNDNGSVQYSIRNFPNYLSIFFEISLLSYFFPKSKFFSRWKMQYFEHENDSDVLQPMAAALLVRKAILDKIGLMDERFEMFFNDVDLCKNIFDNGLKIRYLKDSKVVHKKGVSIYKNRIKMFKTWNRDCIAYFNKYHHNFVLLLWLKISLKLTYFLRVVYYKLRGTK